MKSIQDLEESVEGFHFKMTPDCPLGEYVLIADPRFRVELHEDGSFVVVEVSLLDAEFVKMHHHGRHGKLAVALDNAAFRAVPIRPRGPLSRKVQAVTGTSSANRSL